MQKPKKGQLTPEVQRFLDHMRNMLEDDLRVEIAKMTPQELEAYIEDEKQEVSAEDFARFMRIVDEVARKKAN